jgi:hypothetical protein
MMVAAREGEQTRELGTEEADRRVRADIRRGTAERVD